MCQEWPSILYTHYLLVDTRWFLHSSYCCKHDIQIRFFLDPDLKALSIYLEVELLGHTAWWLILVADLTSEMNESQASGHSCEGFLSQIIWRKTHSKSGHMVAAQRKRHGRRKLSFGLLTLILAGRSVHSAAMTSTKSNSFRIRTQTENQQLCRNSPQTSAPDWNCRDMQFSGPNNLLPWDCHRCTTWTISCKLA